MEDPSITLSTYPGGQIEIIGSSREKKDLKGSWLAV
jgi:hypothetical protein